MNSQVAVKSQANDKGRLWALVPVAILGAMFAGWGVMLSYAWNDPSFGVEPDYYKKAVQFDVYREQERENQRLGFELEPRVRPTDTGHARLQVRAVDQHQEPLTGARLSLVAFHLARSSHLLKAKLAEGEPGVFSADLPMDRPGLWELRFRLERGSELFTQVTRLDLRGPAR